MGQGAGGALCKGPTQDYHYASAKSIYIDKLACTAVCIIVGHLFYLLMVTCTMYIKIPI